MLLFIRFVIVLLSITAGIQASPISFVRSAVDAGPVSTQGSESYGAGAPDFTSILKQYKDSLHGQFRKRANLTASTIPGGVSTGIAYTGAPQYNPTIWDWRQLTWPQSGTWGVLKGVGRQPSP